MIKICIDFVLKNLTLFLVLDHTPSQIFNYILVIDFKPSISTCFNFNSITYTYKWNHHG